MTREERMTYARDALNILGGSDKKLGKVMSTLIELKGNMGKTAKALKLKKQEVGYIFKSAVLFLEVKRRKSVLHGNANFEFPEVPN